MIHTQAAFSAWRPGFLNTLEGRKMRITAYDEAQWRVERLEKMLKLAVTTTGLSMVQIHAIIDEVHDHKGELIITWKHGDCTERMKLAFKDAWHLCGEYNVHHNVAGVF